MSLSLSQSSPAGENGGGLLCGRPWIQVDKQVYYLLMTVDEFSKKSSPQSSILSAYSTSDPRYSYSPLCVSSKPPSRLASNTG